METVFQVGRQEAINIDTRRIEAPDFDRVEVKLGLARRTVCIAVIAVPSTVVPEVDCIDVF